jgi:MFS family permease
MCAPETPDNVVVNGGNRKTYHCGTLTYTKAGLFALFAWLLWGDFCFTLMEAVVPSVLPLKLKALDSPNWLMGMILTTIPGILNMTICPYVSFKSDRYRSKWGRRLPFIIWTIPFLCLSLILLGYSDSISLFLQKNVAALSQTSLTAITIVLIGVFMALFQFFNMFVGSVFYYMINDVVPAQFLSRFVGAFRIVGIAAGAAYNYFVFQFAESAMREIFIGAAVIYFVGFGITCFTIKEGEYPPIEGEADKDNKGWGGIKTFIKECYTNKFYWLIFSFASCSFIISSINAFGVFFNREMGLSLDDIGKYQAITGIAALLAMYFTAIYVDRWHPLRIFAYLCVFGVIGYFMNWVWIFVTLPGKYYFWLCMGGGLIAAFQNALAIACFFPLLMRLFPKSRFGQFCSALALVRSFCTVISGFAAGLFIDFIKCHCASPDFAYRFNFIWSTVFGIITAALGIWGYIHWQKLGADENYHPPAPWSPNKKEEMEIVPFVGPQSRWLNLSLVLFNATMAFSVFALPVLMWWMYLNKAMIAFKWYAVLIIPLSLAAWLCWRIMEKSIRRDMARCLKGEPLRNGIPHHGVFLIMSIQYLLALILCIAQIVVAVNLNMETGAIVFGIANALTNFMLTGCVWTLCLVERGRSINLNKILA